VNFYLNTLSEPFVMKVQVKHFGPRAVKDVCSGLISSTAWRKAQMRCQTDPILPSLYNF
jgi:hypothetical protein